MAEQDEILLATKAQTAAIHRAADMLGALVAELRSGNVKTRKRAEKVARKVEAAITHEPTELERAAARRALLKSRRRLA